MPNAPIILTHNKTSLLLKTGVFFNEDGTRKILKDEYGNLQPLGSYINAMSSSIKKIVNKKYKFIQASKDEQKEEYRNQFGWAGEVLCEFWLRRFGHLYDLINIRDTSEHEFNRGFDFRAGVIHYPDLEAHIQVKMSADATKRLSEGKLSTFIDEMEKAGVVPRFGVLMFPTSTVSLRKEALGYQNSFQQRGVKMFHIVTQEVMCNVIRERCLGGHEEFLDEFMSAVEAYISQ